MPLACVILNYNDAQRTANLARLLSGYGNVDSVVVVDNNSSDNSLEKLKEIVNLEKVELTVSPQNGGYGYGNNLGISECSKLFAQSEDLLVLIANPDVVVEESAVEEMLACFEHDDRCFSCAPIQHNINNQPVWNSAWDIPSPQAFLAQLSPLLSQIWRIRYRPNRKDAKERFLRVDCLSGALLMIHAGRFAEIGGYDERVFLFSEETSIGIRAQERFNSYLCTEKSYRHEHSTSINASISSYLKRYKLLHTSIRHVLDCDYHLSSSARITCAIIDTIVSLEGYVKAPVWKLIGLAQKMRK